MVLYTCGVETRNARDLSVKLWRVYGVYSYILCRVLPVLHLDFRWIFCLVSGIKLFCSIMFVFLS